MAHCALPDRTLSRRTQQTQTNISDDGSRTQGQQAGRHLGNEHERRRVELHAGERDGCGPLQLGTRGAPTLPQSGGEHAPEAHMFWSGHPRAPPRRYASPHFSALPCTRTTAPPSAHLPASLQVAAQFSDVSDNRTQSWERSEVSPAPTCLHPGPALRGASRGRAHCHTHQLPSRPTGHQRGQVLLGRCTFLAGRGPQPAP